MGRLQVAQSIGRVWQDLQVRNPIGAVLIRCTGIRGLFTCPSDLSRGGFRPVARSLKHRSNHDWIAALGSSPGGDEAALSELQEYLRRVFGKLVGGHLNHDDIDDLIQETLARVVESLSSFRGDSAFTTWVTGIATRTAFSELRRRRVRASRSDNFAEAQDEARQMADPRGFPADESLARRDLLEALRCAIGHSLTERQRVVVLAELAGVPTVEIAERMGTNRNALYKVAHDARRRLRQALLDGGFSAESFGSIRGEIS